MVLLDVYDGRWKVGKLNDQISATGVRNAFNFDRLRRSQEVEVVNPYSTGINTNKNKLAYNLHCTGLASSFLPPRLSENTAADVLSPSDGEERAQPSPPI